MQASWMRIGLYTVNKLRLKERSPKLYFTVYYRMSALYGSRDADRRTREWLAKLVLILSIVLVTALVFFLSSTDDLTVLLLPAAVGAIVPVAMLHDLDNKIRNKRREIAMDLPLLLNQMVLLINAGETVQQAMLRIAEQHGKSERPLFREWWLAAEKLKNRFPFSRVMEELNQQCGVQDVSVFVNVILLNYRRGGEELVNALSTLSRNMWEARKNAAKTLGEEASSKLLFPMVLIFLVVLTVIAAPALMWMNQ